MTSWCSLRLCGKNPNLDKPDIKQSRPQDMGVFLRHPYSRSGVLNYRFPLAPMALFEIAGVRNNASRVITTHRGPGLEISLIVRLNVSQPLL
jgi:hypothetical protein